ncbi:outer membrane beta-barrel protein [Mucilaginibacter sp.]
MKYFYLSLLVIILFPLFLSAQSIRDTSKSPAITAPVHFFAGVLLNSFSTSISSTSDELNNAKSSKSAKPGFILGADVPLDQNYMWVFRGEAGFTSDKNSFNDDYTTGSVTQINESLSFKQTIINISPQVMFNILKSSEIDVYVSTGIIIDIRSYKDKSFTTTTTYSVSGTTSTGADPEPDFKSATFCIPAKVGVVAAKHINIYAAYNAKTSLNNDSNFAINETSFIIGVNYVFGK